MNNIELVHDRILSAIVCCDVDPEADGAFDEVDKRAKTLYNGTDEHPWHTVRENHDLHGGDWENIKPIACEDYPGRWHYVMAVF